MLNGWSSAGEGSSSRSGAQWYPPLSAGLVAVLAVLDERQQGIKKRVEMIRAKYEQQREAAEKFLTFAISQTTQVRGKSEVGIDNS